jgi:aryl-alcohol dehydrogenase-like predicted oxidoreductase
MNFGAPTEQKEAEKIMASAIEAGINMIDTADKYSAGESERMIGEYLAKNGKRNEVFLATKVYNPMGPGPNDKGLSRHHLIEGCEESLRRLQTDHIDLYYLHRFDENVPIDETLAALDYLRSQGKIRYIGSSIFPPWRTAEMLKTAERYGYPKFVCEQPPYNLLDRRIENEFVPMCEHFDMGLITWAPLAHGVLAGKYSSADDIPEGSRGSRRPVFAERITEEGVAVGNSVVNMADDLGITPAQFAASWILHQPGITAEILGPRNLQQLEDLLPALEVELPNEVLEACDELVPPGNYAANFFNTSKWVKS